MGRRRMSRGPAQGDYDYWLMSDGEFVEVKAMADSHLLATVAKIKRENWRVHWLGHLQAEVFRRRMERAANEGV